MTRRKMTPEECYSRAIELGILVDLEDVWIITNLPFHITPAGYARSKIDRQGVFLHNIIVGNALQGYHTDYINRNKLDNRRSNLRTVKQSENVINSDRVEEAFNIYQNTGGTFYVGIRRNGEIVFRSVKCTTIEEAILIRDNWYEVYAKKADE